MAEGQGRSAKARPGGGCGRSSQNCCAWANESSCQERGRGPTRGALHAPDCEEAPQGAPLLDLDHTLGLAENPATRLCALCGCAHKLTPILRGFDHGAEPGPDPGRRRAGRY
ncbi:DUF6233 domain-containing protein [Streptomyces coeruleorubidus]|uniref:DUF6233 domain-containing protein n=1 Tax=Streptomyces coeruleorubidus TaxID=116188 RepID=UPI003828CA63